jgi:hypothetical protein
MSLHHWLSTKRPLRLPVMVLALLALTVFGALAQQATPDTLTEFEFRTDPVLQVASYYNAINLGDYERAYSYWENPPQGATLAQFEAGFAETERVAAFAWLPVMQDAGAGNLYAQVPLLLVADQTNGNQRIYAGCITTHKVNVPEGDATEPDPNWRLNDSSIAEVNDFDLALLQNVCDQTIGLADAVENLTSPVGLLTSYFSAIVNHEYDRAYSYWETPPNPTLADFIQGFAETGDVSLVLRLDISAGGAAGSTYASLPAMVTAAQTDGAIQYYAGCYVTRKSNVPVGNATEPDPNWRFYDSNVNAVSYNGGSMSLLAGVCAEQ